MPTTAHPLRIDYLARDYTALRQMLLDRLSVQIPTWTERHEADLEIVLLELLAYTGDYLSYYQDAVAAEAYLFTARQRISMRRHARLLDYTIDDGMNSRVLVHVKTAIDGVGVPAGTSLLTETFSDKPALPPTVLDSYTGIVFQTMLAATLYRASHGMTVEPELEGEWSLPAGRTHAYLSGDMTHLVPGEFVRLHVTPEQNKRHVVRLVQTPTRTSSPLGRDATRIDWSQNERLPEPFAVTALTASGRVLGGLCLVLGNMLLCDEGRTVVEQLPPVPAQGSFHPKLPFAHVGCGTPLPQGPDAAHITAAQILQQDPRKSRALITLYEQVLGSGPAAETAAGAALVTGSCWESRRDLLSSNRFARDFVAETDNEGSPVLRFGDNTYGRRPQSGTIFQAVCRIGSGSLGNIGPGVVRHIVLDSPYIVSVTNPDPATGGTDPELTEAIRTDAPQYFRRHRVRAITADDYAAILSRLPGTTNVRARFTEADAVSPAAWPGWFRQVTLYAQSTGTDETPEQFRLRCLDFIEPYALIGDSLQVVPSPVTEIDLHMSITAAAGYAPETVRRQVRAAVGRAVENSSFGFGESVRAGRWISAAAAIQGVDSALAVHWYAPAGSGQQDAVSAVDVHLPSDTFAHIRSLRVETRA